MSNTVPDGWSTGIVGDVCHTIYRYPTFYGMETFSTGIPVVRGEHILNSGRLSKDWGDYKHVTHEFSDDYPRTKLSSGDVVMAVRGTVGKFAAVDASHEQAQISPNVIRLAPDSGKVVPRFFYYILFPAKAALLNDCVSATGVPALNGSDIKNATILRPPLPEQQKIATILSSVDDVIEKTQAQIDKLKVLKTGMMQELLTKGIGHTEFKDSPVGRIPVGWDVRNLEEVVERIIDCEHKTAPYVDKSDYLVVRTSNVRHGELTYDDMKFTTVEGYDEWTKRAVPSVGDVLFTREAPAGESCMVPHGKKVCMGQRMVLLRPDTDMVFPEYFSLFLTSEFAELSIYELSIGTTVTRINIEDIKRIPCIIPSLDEQKKLTAIVQSVQSSISSKQLKLDSLNSTKKALMQDLLTGNVRVKVD